MADLRKFRTGKRRVVAPAQFGCRGVAYSSSHASDWALRWPARVEAAAAQAQSVWGAGQQHTNINLDSTGVRQHRRLLPGNPRFSKTTEK